MGDESEQARRLSTGLGEGGLEANRNVDIEAAADPNILGQAVASQFSFERSGPLPDPLTLAEYEKVLPGTADRIISTFERQVEHRHSLEGRVITSQQERQAADIALERRGQCFAFVIGMTGLLGGGAVILFGGSTASAIAGSALGGATLGGLVTAFLASQKSRRMQRELESSDS